MLKPRVMSTIIFINPIFRCFTSAGRSLRFSAPTPHRRKKHKGRSGRETALVVRYER